jgi:hypothetical protein
LPPWFSFVIAPNATLENDIVSAIMSAATNNVMRFLIASHLLSWTLFLITYVWTVGPILYLLRLADLLPLSPKEKPAVISNSRLRHWLPPPFFIGAHPRGRRSKPLPSNACYSTSPTTKTRKVEN